MPFIRPAGRDIPEKTEYVYGFQKGLNKLQDESLIDDHELSTSINTMLVVDGIIKRPGSLNFGDPTGSRVFSGSPFYTSALTNNRFIIRDGGTSLQYYAGTTPTNISGATITADTRAEFVMARDTLYYVNPSDSMVKIAISGGIPTATTFTALTTPTNLVVTPTFSVIAAVTSITRSSTTATVTTSTAHGLTTGDYVTVSGAVETEYNVTAAITVLTTTTFTYTVSGAPASPATGTLVLKYGGITAYSYRVSAYNSVGETLGCVSVAISNGKASLSSTNYIRLTWDAVTSAVGYVIYGRKASAISGIGETRLSTTTTTTYDDTGIDTPSTILTPQEGNSTGGAKGSMIIYALGRLFVAGDPSNPSRLFYSGAGVQLDDFSTAFAGGWIDIAKNDGDKITAIFFYQNNIVVWKQRSIWKFSFTSAGLPQVELITNEIGCCAFRTLKIVNNDAWFAAIKDGRLTVYSLGNVQNYFNALRTTEKSLNVSAGSLLDAANLTYAQNACSYYFRNQYLLSIANGGSTYNDRVFVYDSRFNSWVGYWTGINANFFISYQDENGNEDLYCGSETTGYLIKLYTGTNDNGIAIDWKIQTKNFNQKLFDQYKIFRNPVVWFKDVTGGSISGFLINDGVVNSGSFNISAALSGIGFGFDMWGRTKFGDSLGAAGTATNSDQPVEIIFNKISRSMKIELDEESGSGSFKFLGLSYKWTLLQGKPLPAANRIRLST